jgi:hypothetical protein
MNEDLRQALLTAQAFARVFIEAVESEVSKQAYSEDRDNTQTQLAASLRLVRQCESGR